jgi:hypothetical protein
VAEQPTKKTTQRTLSHLDRFSSRATRFIEFSTYQAFRKNATCSDTFS